MAKYVILLGDGMADQPVAALGGKTPLEAANTPTLDKLASRGEIGMADTTPPGHEPGSDVNNMAVLGYGAEYYTGRSPLEAAAMGVDLGSDEVAFRCNLVTLAGEGPDSVMADYSAGSITTEEASEIIKTLDEKLGSENLRFHPGVSYRHLMVFRGGPEDVKLTPPHDLSDQNIKDYYAPHPLLREITDKAREILKDHPVNKARIAAGKNPASSIWLWGQGRAPSMPSLKEKRGLTGAMISAVDLLKGIGIYADMEVIHVEGATGELHTNYAGKVAAAIDALKRHDLVFVHLEGPDECGHQGAVDDKVKAIEWFDERVVKPVLEYLDSTGEEWHALICPDHPTPVETKTHTRDPIPFLIARSGDAENGGTRRYTEKEAEDTGLMLDTGIKLLPRLMQQ